MSALAKSSLLGGRDASRLLSPKVVEPVAAGKVDDDKSALDIDDYFLPADDELDSYFQARSTHQPGPMLGTHDGACEW